MCGKIQNKIYLILCSYAFILFCFTTHCLFSVDAYINAKFRPIQAPNGLSSWASCKLYCSSLSRDLAYGGFEVTMVAEFCSPGSGDVNLCCNCISLDIAWLQTCNGCGSMNPDALYLVKTENTRLYSPPFLVEYYSDGFQSNFQSPLPLLVKTGVEVDIRLTPVSPWTQLLMNLKGQANHAVLHVALRNNVNETVFAYLENGVYTNTGLLSYCPLVDDVENRLTIEVMDTMFEIRLEGSVIHQSSIGIDPLEAKYLQIFTKPDSLIKIHSIGLREV